MLALFSMVITSCKENTDQQQNSSVSENSDGLITLTLKQKQLAGIRTSMISESIRYDKVNCKGQLIVPPDNIAKVSSPINGMVSNIYVRKGEKVQKGQVLVSLHHQDILDIQNEFLQSSIDFNYLKNEYFRQKALLEDGAGSQKLYEKVEAEFLSKQSHLEAIKLKLQLLNIKPEEVTADNMQNEIYLFAPITGQIKNIDFTIGEIVQPDNYVIEIIGNEYFTLELQVFEKDLNSIAQGQKVTYDCSIPESKTIEHNARVTIIGNYINNETNTATVFAQPETITSGMKHGMIINAEIQVDEFRSVFIPNGSIITRDREKMIFLAKSDTSFEKISINAGITLDGYTAIENTSLLNKEIVVEGVHFLNSILDEE